MVRSWLRAREAGTRTPCCPCQNPATAGGGERRLEASRLPVSGPPRCCCSTGPTGWTTSRKGRFCRPALAERERSDSAFHPRFWGYQESDGSATGRCSRRREDRSKGPAACGPIISLQKPLGRDVGKTLASRRSGAVGVK